MPDFTGGLPVTENDLPLNSAGESGEIGGALLGEDLFAGTPTIYVPLRAPQYGLPLALKLQYLQDSVPTDTDSYVGFFASMPSRAGVGGIECSGSGYTRIAHSAWRSAVVSEYIARRMNTGECLWPALTGPLSFIGWGIWNELTSGSLRAFGLVRNADGSARVFNLLTTQQPRFGDGDLRWGIQ